MNFNLILIFSLFFSLVVSAQEKKIWDYPIKPGSQEWASFTTGQQMLEACQVPKKVLNTSTTKELVDICLNYPMFFDYSASNDERKGISKMISDFNGLSELSKRKDGTFELINAYKEYPVFTEIQQESSKDYYTPYKLPFLELLLADGAFMNQLDKQKSAELEKIILEKYVSKLKNFHVYSLYNIKKTFLLGAIVINNHSIADKTPRQQYTIKRFIDNYSNADETLLTGISKIISEL